MAASLVSQAGEPSLDPNTTEEATLFPVPDYSGDLWKRSALTGDWGRTRQKLAEQGVQFDIRLNQYFHEIVDGGIEKGNDYSGSADYRLKIDTGKAGWWSGGFLEVHAESYFGNSVDPKTGAIMSVNTDYALSAPHGRGTYLSHVVYTQFLAENFAVVLGKLDTTVGDANAFAHGSGDEKFQNLAFSFNPVTLLSAPYSTLGMGAMWLPKENVVVSASAYDLEGDLESSGFDTVFEGGTGYNMEVQVTTNFMDKPGHHLFGGTFTAGDISALQDPRLFLPGFTPATEDGTWNLYYNFDQYLVANESTGGGWGIFGRVGIADEKTNPVPLFLSTGFGGTGVITSRPDDRFGIGVYYLETSDEFPPLVQGLLGKSESGLEFFYDVAVTPWFRVAANAQVIAPVVETVDTAVVLGLRSTIVF